MALCSAYSVVIVVLAINVIEPCLSLTVIDIEDFTKLSSYGIIRRGPGPTILERPGAWMAALRPLDADVSSLNVFRVTNAASPTTLTFHNNGNLCELSELYVTAKYFSQNSAMKVFPCESAWDTFHCYGYVPSKVEWVNQKWSMNISQLKEGKEVELLVQLIPGGGDAYFFFEKITIEHDGVHCDTTTEASTTSEHPTTSDIPSTTETWVTETPIDESTTTAFTDPTTSPTTEVTEDETEATTSTTTTTTTDFPECSSSTPTPEPCDCCDRCGSKEPEEIHHHYHNTYNYYYANPNDHLIEQK